MTATSTRLPSALSHEFVGYLSELARRDRAALAILRRSLGFEPGAYPPAYPFVERFVGAERHADDPYRRALYVIAGLFALQPKQRDGQSFATAFARLRIKRDSDSIEHRFIALLAADPDNVPDYLRQAVSLLAADGIDFDFALLLGDLSRWLNPHALEQRDTLRQRWARDFYRALASPNTEDAAEYEPHSNVE